MLYYKTLFKMDEITIDLIKGVQHSKTTLFVKGSVHGILLIKNFVVHISSLHLVVLKSKLIYTDRGQSIKSLRQRC
jgi:hypothetical protein